MSIFLMKILEFWTKLRMVEEAMSSTDQINSKVQKSTLMNDI
jgi:hypothetical protein